MKWHIGIVDGNENYEISVSANLGEKQPVKQTILRMLQPNARIIYMTHTSEIPVSKKKNCI